MAQLSYGGATAKWLKNNMPIQSQAKYVEYGFGQVEPNHLSAQRTSQVYAQLPANKDIEVLEQGQFVKYDYATHTNGIGEVNFTGAGEWMLVYNEIKLYREHQLDCEFAMVKGNYQARVYSPLDGTKAAEEMYGPTRFLQGVREKYDPTNENADKDGFVKMDEIKNPVTGEVADYSVATKVHDYYEMNDINDPNIEEGYRRRLFMKLRAVKHPEAMMPAGTTMVPRVFKTMPGDIFTTNTINAKGAVLKNGDTLKVGEKGILEVGSDDKMTWQVVKVYTMPDHQRGVKIMRIV